MHLEIIFWIFTFLVKVNTEIVRELRTWAEDRFIECVFCMDYDRSNVSISGCKIRKIRTCRGNICFMKLHKGDSAMYTSGCLNITESVMKNIAHAQDNSVESSHPNGTLLCEQAPDMVTCLCSNTDRCNFIEVQSSFSEYNRTTIFDSVNIDESWHFRVFLPLEYRKRFAKTNSSATNYFSFFMLAFLIIF